MTVLTKANLSRYWNPSTGAGHAMVLGPLLTLHEAWGLWQADGQPGRDVEWKWGVGRSIEEALPIVWNMTGRWRARRKVTLSRDDFDEVVPPIVRRLASSLNRLSVRNLRDLATSDAHTYRTAVRKLHKGVLEISMLRKTAEVQPVLGSKVLHHFFPSLVPVYDLQLIRNGVIKSSAFLKFEKANAHAQGKDEDWLVFKGDKEAGGKCMLSFHQYFAMCASLFSDVSSKELDALRDRMGRGFTRVAPGRMISERRSLLWHLDAKVAEYCLLGDALREGVLTDVQGV